MRESSIAQHSEGGREGGGQGAHGVGGGDEGAEGEALGEGHGVGGVRLGEAVEGEAHEDGGDEGPHDGVQHLGGMCGEGGKGVGG